LEVSLNGAFDTYRDLYFEGGVSSVYLWDLEEEGSGSGSKEMSFAGVVLLKKSKCSLWALYEEYGIWLMGLLVALSTSTSSASSSPTGSWDSLHVFECHERGRSAKYKLTSTVMLVLETATGAKVEGKGSEDAEGKGGVTLSGSMTRQVSSPID
jgi:capping protein beta